MWTRRSHWLFVKIRVKRVPIPIILPLRIIFECIDALEDLMAFCGRFVKGLDGRATVSAIVDAVWTVTSLGAFDLVDVETGNDVKIRICLR